MTQDEVQEVRACLPQSRTLFAYGKDWYAIQLLKMAMVEPCPVSALKRSGFGPLLAKERVRRWIGSLGRNVLRREDLDLLWPDESEVYRLTLGTFDGWAQTSRRGRQGWNLVLQLNLHGGEAQFMEKPPARPGSGPLRTLLSPHP